MLTILSWIIAGLIVGAIARLLVPGRQNIGVALTIVLGIVGALVGGFISTLIFGSAPLSYTGDYPVDTAWPGWIMAIVGGVLVLWITLAVAGGTRSSGVR